MAKKGFFSWFRRDKSKEEAEAAEAAKLAQEQQEQERLAAEQAAEQARLEAERIESERIAAEQAKAARIEAERVAAEQAEAARIEAERVAAEQAEAARIEAERIAAEQAEAARIEAERFAAEQAEAQKAAAEQAAIAEARILEEQAEAVRIEAERMAAEQAEAARIEAERIAAEQAEAARIEAERIAAEQAEAARIEAERIAAEQAEAARIEAERVAAEQAEAERIEAERIAAEQAEAARIEAERIAAEQAEAARLEAERVAAEQAEAARLEAERIAVEQAEAARIEAERVAAEQAEAERIEAERIAAEQAAEQPEPQAKPVKEGLFARLKRGLKRTSESIGSGFIGLFSGKKIDDDLFEELEEQLLIADVGVETTTRLINSLTEQASRKQLKDGEALYDLLREEMQKTLDPVSAPLIPENADGPFVILMVGVNGVGKTTTIGKLAKQYQAQGKSVMLAAGDTFRAAAVEQLQVWGQRNDIPVIAQHTGADSASVLFDALQAARARNVDVLIADTAGRLQNKAHLMDELKKVVRVMKKQDETAPHEVMLTLDASTGQNAISQAQLFQEAVGVTGITISKLDGTAKGGVIFAIADKFGIPIRHIGVGEQIDDLRTFDAKDFIEALFSQTKDDKDAK
ncbi:signal recognition particle-docking protein FtsY [Shewanella fidelis]|uniref:signal recognition particle-docking protein FtsY n=1 Tax=Shewanella fidelis TaxID=173509 RepID=UPI00296E8545|nr:signal recognition particle-docking protein FtsY [Shewanella fidelis]MDW4820187.1 signal recognition particle-docking protein FtsY [Shewanella fidelis]